MLNNKISDYKTINTAIAIFGAFSALVLALAPATVATIFKISYQVQSTGSWFSSGRAIAIMCIGIFSIHTMKVSLQDLLMKFMLKKLL